MSENEECSSYFGVYIGENYVSKTFEDPIMMPYGNKGFEERRYNIKQDVGEMIGIKIR